MAKKFVGQEYMAATNGKGLHQQSKGHRILARTTVTFSTIITVASVLIVVFCLFFQMCPVKGTSMMKTLNPTGKDTDKVVTCTIGEPQRGDIIVMKLYIQDTSDRYYIDAANGDTNALKRLRELGKTDSSSQQTAASRLASIKKDPYINADKQGNYELIIKRLIGKPGDKISMRRENSKFYIYLNGDKLQEDYLDVSTTGNNDAANNESNFYQLWNILNKSSGAKTHDWLNTNLNEILKPNTMGDSNASDYYLEVPAGYYFVMGDNRGGAMKTGHRNDWKYSWDSCYFGPLPISNYYSHYVDKITNNTSMPKYLWNKFVYYVCFGWAWQK